MTPDRRYLLSVLALGIVLFTHHLSHRDFWSPDEPRYAGIARSITESGDWLVLRENGRPYTQKPPLYFWILAGVARLGSGVNEFTSRIPSSLFALATIALTFAWGRQQFGARVGLFSGLILATAQRFWIEARWVHIDMLLSLLILSAMVSVWRGFETDRTGWWLVGYLAIGLGCLAKGPVALALPVTGILGYLGAGGELSKIRKTHWTWGIPLTIAPAATWLVTASRRSGFDPLTTLRTQIVERFQVGIHHPRPFFYFLYSLPLEFLPWSFFLPAAIVHTFPVAGQSDRRPRLFLHGWILGGFALLSLSAEKRPSYLLPLFPPLALLVALLWEAHLVRIPGSSVDRWIRVTTLVVAAAGVGCLVFLPHLAKGEPGLSHRLVPLSLLFALGGLGCAVAARTRWRSLAMMTVVATASLGYLWISGSLLPWLNPYKSARPFAQRIVDRAGDNPLCILDDFQPALAYYTHRVWLVVHGPEELRAFLNREPAAACVVEEPRLSVLTRALSLRTVDRQSVGHRTYLLVVRKPPEASPVM